MTTIEQRDKKITSRRNRLDVLTPKVEKLTERVEKFDEGKAALVERLSKAKRERDLLAQEIDWLKSMPVDGTPDAETEDATPAETEDTADAETEDTGEATPEDGVPTVEYSDSPRARDASGHFVSASA